MKEAVTPLRSTSASEFSHKVCYRVRYKVSSKVLLNVFMAVPQAGGPILQLLCSRARKKLQHELLKKCKQNLTK